MRKSLIRKVGNMHFKHLLTTTARATLTSTWWARRTWRGRRGWRQRGRWRWWAGRGWWGRSTTAAFPLPFFSSWKKQTTEMWFLWKWMKTFIRLIHTAIQHSTWYTVRLYNAQLSLKLHTHTAVCTMAVIKLFICVSFRTPQFFLFLLKFKHSSFLALFSSGSSGVACALGH